MLIFNALAPAAGLRHEENPPSCQTQCLQIVCGPHHFCYKVAWGIFPLSGLLKVSYWMWWWLWLPQNLRAKMWMWWQLSWTCQGKSKICALLVTSETLSFLQFPCLLILCHGSIGPSPWIHGTSTTQWGNGPKGKVWVHTRKWPDWGLNPGPPGYILGALTTELYGPKYRVLVSHSYQLWQIAYPTVHCILQLDFTLLLTFVSVQCSKSCYLLDKQSVT